MFVQQFKTFHKIATKHPIAGKNLLKTYSRFFKWQIISRLKKDNAIVFEWYNGLKIWVKRGLSSATAQYYFGLSEYEDMRFTLDFLKKDDIFVDIGANVGTFSLLASGVCEAKTLAIEPIFSTFEWLEKNIQLNDLQHLITAKKLAMGENEGQILMTIAHTQQNHVLTNTEENQAHESVTQTTLDAFLAEMHLEKSPILLKIDVEGFEQAVVNGATKTLQNPDLQAIIIELMGHSARYGYSEANIDKQLRNFGFLPYTYTPLSKELHFMENFNTHNTIYIRDLNFVKKRLNACAPS